MSSNQTKQAFTLSLSLIKYVVPRITLLQDPKKIPSSSNWFFNNKNIFHRVMWPFWVSFSWSEFHREKQENREPFLPHLPLFFLSLFISLPASLFLPIASLSFFLFLSFSLFITFLTFFFLFYP